MNIKKPLSVLVNSLVMASVICQPVYAASSVISDTPMAVQNTAKSNVMFTMDTSGGMDVDVLLPTYNSMYYESGVVPGNNPANLNGNFFLYPVEYRHVSLNAKYRTNKKKKGNGAAWMNLMLEGDVGSPDKMNWMARNAHYNALYYDPFKTYAPWNGTDSTGALFTNANPLSVQLDPYSFTFGAIDITAPVSTGSVVNGWTVPQAHTNLSATGTNISSSGGRFYNSTWYIPTYYTWTDLNNNGVMELGEETRYEIKNPAVTCVPTKAGAVIPGCLGKPATYPSGRTYIGEMRNFANWFQYYRTVMLSFQAAVGKQLDTLGTTNVGMTFLEPATIPAPVLDMAVPANLQSLRSQIYDLSPNLQDWRQPIHERMSQVFNYFKQTGTVNGVPAPIQYSCQQNFNVLVTSGYLNENGGNAKGFTNYFTGNNPSAPFPVGDYDTTGNGPSSGQKPYADFVGAGTSYADTLADWALYIYDQNLRPDLQKGNVQLVPTAHETNPNPHLDTYVIAPGARPTLSDAPTLLNPATANPYDVLLSIIWPQPVFLDQSTIDDLWHAAVNGRGKFVGGYDVYGSLNTVMNDIMARIGAAAAVAVSNANISPGDSFSYASSYNTGNWTGDIQAYPMDLVTGTPSSIGKWIPSARDQLDSLVLTSSRKIATFNGTSGIPFRWTSMLPAQQALLNSPVTASGLPDGQDVLAFLRGDRSLEGTIYRTRGHVLGDIIDAEPVIIKEPQYSYTDSGYAAFKTQYVSTTPRPKIVYQAANDGMVHAFDADKGDELWSYVPGAMFDSRLTGFPNTSTLVNLSAKDTFSHLYMVNGTPASGDVDFGNTLGNKANPDWHTILVGGYRKGGRGYYALDVTQPVVSTESDVAAKVLWEFPNASTPASVRANLGFSYGKPVIVKTAATGWVVLVTSGMNNGTNAGDSGGDGRGHLFVLNAKTGNVIKDILTDSGTSSTPSGFADITAWVDNTNVDNTVKQAYGTDLLGNVWRFDFSSPSMSGWTTSLLATLVDANGNVQPITTAPEVALQNGKHMVFVGTGQYLSLQDVPPTPAVSGLPSTQTQTMYGLVDDLSVPGVGTAVIAPLRSQLNQVSLSATNASTRSVTVNTSNMKLGWYLDLSLAGGALGERVVTDPAIVNTTLVFTTNLPSSADPCSPGGNSWLYALNYGTGAQVAGSLWAATSMGNTLASRPILVQMPDSTVKGLVRKSNATTSATDIPVATESVAGRRVSWREITQ